MPAAGFPRTARGSRHKGHPSRHTSKDSRWETDVSKKSLQRHETKDCR